MLIQCMADIFHHKYLSILAVKYYTFLAYISITLEVRDNKLELYLGESNEQASDEEILPINIQHIFATFSTHFLQEAYGKKCVQL